MNEKARTLYEQADEYCRFIAENVITAHTVSPLIELLMTLYLLAMNLPETEPETNDKSSDIPKAISIRFGEQISTTYWEMFDPYQVDCSKGELLESTIKLNEAITMEWRKDNG